MTTLLSLRHLSGGYPGRPSVLTGVSLEVNAGEFVGLVGPNGSGKTTVVRAASRSLRPSSGQALLDGQDVWTLPARGFARKVAVVPQDIQTPFDMTALEVVLLGRHPHVGRLHLENAEDEHVAMEALESVGAEHLADRSIQRISGGERQRVIIAKALAQEPSLLLLDEPTSHLDMSHQIEILSLAARLASERGIGVLGVLHDLNLAAAWCGRIAVLHEGRIAADGAPGEVITESLLARVWHARMWVKHHPATGRPFLLPMPPMYEPEEHAAHEGASVHVVCGGGSGGPAITALMQDGFPVTCGVVNVGDSDEEVCRAMNIPHVAEAPFSPISPDRAAANLRMALDADAVLLTDFCVGPGNLDNLRTVEEALRRGKPVVRLRDDDPGNADYTGGEGTQILERIDAGCMSVTSVAKMVEALKALPTARQE